MKRGSQAYAENGIVQQALRVAKKEFPELYLVGDVCMCEYTSHGHCGIIKGDSVDNDKTLPLLAKTALSQVIAGADMVAPSDMMDGRVRAIREELDAAGYIDTPIMSYAAKYASAFYGPFREAAGSSNFKGNRKTYQMDFHNRKEAIKEVFLDLEEGADIIMVKPALSYLDIIREVSDRIAVPTAAYSVSGEYAMIKAAAKAGMVDEQAIVAETTVSIFRAGADILITYFAKEIAKDDRRRENRIMSNAVKSVKLFEEAQKYIPGGVNSPARAFKAVSETPRFIEKADGAYIYDVDGNQYIDYIGSWGPMILGSNNPVVLKAVQEAIVKGLSYGAATEAEVTMAKLVCELVPSMEMVRMVNSGTEATMSALRTATRLYRKK